MKISAELESQILEEYKLTQIVSKIAKKFHHSNDIIYKVLEINNIILEHKRFKRGKSLMESQVPELISKYLNGDGICDCAKAFNTSETVIEKTLKKNNIKIRSLDESHKVHKKVRNKHKINEHFFDNPENWTEEQAWTLGWLASDGTNDTNRYRFSMQLIEEDKIILETIRDLLKSERPIRNRPQRGSSKPSCSIDINNEKLSKTLFNLGIVDRKSLNYVFPKFLRPDLIRHFIRGYFEGDGCICKSSNKYNNHKFSIIATKQFLIHLSLIMNEQVGIPVRPVTLRINDINHKLYNNITADYYVYKTEDMYLIYQHLYKNCNYFLPRKKEKFDNFIEYLINEPKWKHLNASKV